MPDSKFKFFKKIQPKMKEIATDTIRATFMKLDPKKREFTFEVFIFFNKKDLRT
jgi:hypothetical protein